MADTPEGIVLTRHRDLRGRKWHIWVRRVLLGLVALFVLAALLNVFGQNPTTTTASASTATLDVHAPATVRGGLLWQARFTVHATEELKNAVLVLSDGWLRGNTINTIEPSPLGEGSRNGSLTLQLGHVPRGERHVLYLQFQTNPNGFGRRDADVQLQDGERMILSIHRTITVLP